MSAPTSRRRFLRTAGVGGVGVVAGLATGVAAGRTMAASAESGFDSAGTGSQDPVSQDTASQVAATLSEATAADIGFCADMSTHHIQALAMCQRVLLSLIHI